MNILFIITKSEIGGAQKYVKEQIDICTGSFKIFLATNEEGWLTENVQDKVHDMLLNPAIESRVSLSYLRLLQSYIRLNDIHLIVASSANAGLYGRLAAYFTGRHSIYVSHGWSSVYNGGRFAFLLNRIERYLGKICSRVICVSNADYQIARHVIKIPSEKLWLLRNSIFPIGSQDNRPVDINRLKLLSVARFAHPKRMDLLVQAMHGINFVELHIIGGGTNFEAVRSYVESKKMDNVFLHGEINDFRDFSHYDSFILISDSEGLPMSALEAMSAGLPLILSNVGGCKELIVNETLLVRNDSADIHRAINLLREKYFDLKSKIKPFFDLNFNLNINKNEFISLYKSFHNDKEI